MIIRMEFNSKDPNGPRVFQTVHASAKEMSKSSNVWASSCRTGQLLNHCYTDQILLPASGHSLALRTAPISYSGSIKHVRLLISNNDGGTQLLIQNMGFSANCHRLHRTYCLVHCATTKLGFSSMYWSAYDLSPKFTLKLTGFAQSLSWFCTRMIDE